MITIHDYYGLWLLLLLVTAIAIIIIIVWIIIIVTIAGYYHGQPVRDSGWRWREWLLLHYNYITMELLAGEKKTMSERVISTTEGWRAEGE